MAGNFEIKGAGKAITIGFTDQRLSPHAGSATFLGMVAAAGLVSANGGSVDPTAPVVQQSSANHLLPLEKALSFMHGLLCDARKLTHVAYLQRDPVAPELISLRRVASLSARSHSSRNPHLLVVKLFK